MKVRLSERKKLIRIILILLVLTLNISCDQVSKSIARKQIDYRETIVVVKNWFTITKVENTGAFLGVFKTTNRTVQLVVLIGIPLLMIGYALYYLFRTNRVSHLISLGLCLIVGGGLGNQYDRIFRGSVTDFLQVDLQIFRTGVFNLADFSIMVGLVLVLFEVYIRKQKLNPAPEEQTEPQ
jgi:signal peptidase II